MKRSKFNTSQILLIIIGVLVAIVIGFNSNAVGNRNAEKEWSKALKFDSNKVSQHLLDKSVDQTKNLFKLLLTSN
jgi:uncharacterized membrane protein